MVSQQQVPTAPLGFSKQSLDDGYGERALGFAERRAGWILGTLMLLDAVLLLYMGRGLSFFFDDWDFVTHDYGGGLHSLLAAHVGNFVLFPVALYKVLFHIVGLNHYAAFRLVVVILHLICGGLVYVLAARRISRVPALMAAALVLFLGAAWEDLLWAFQVTYLLAVAGGLAAWLLLEREERSSDIAAMLFVLVAVGSSSLGLAITIGVAVELAWQRQWRRGWIVVVPALIYVLWYLGYGESQITRNSLINAPGFVADLAAAAFGALVGRGLDWGRPLAVLGALVLVRRLARPLPVSPRLAGLLATGISLWIITGAARSTVSSPDTSRYVYLGAVVIVLIGVELLSNITITPRAIAIATPLVAFFAITGLTVMHNGALGLRSTSKIVTAELGALELAAAYAPPTYQPDAQRAPQITAAPYLHTVRAIGSSPADSAAGIARAEAPGRAAADGVLVALEAPKVIALVAVPSPLAPAPAVSALVAGTQAQRGPCVDLTPSASATLTAVLTLPRGGVVIHDLGKGAVSLALARFGSAFLPIPGAVPAGGSAALTLPPDRDNTPWQLRVVAASPLSVCGSRP
jgi:hypothetical protein